MSPQTRKTQMKLTTTQIQKLEQLEAVIEKGEKTFVEVGLALTEIKEQKLYTRDYDTFEAYCQERWGWGSRRGYQLITAANVVASLPLGCEQAVHTESAARELSKLPPAQQVEIAEAAVESGKPLTAPAVRKLVMPPMKPKEAPAEEDKTGYAIPKSCLELWNRGREVHAMLSDLSAIKGNLRKAQDEKDVLFAEVNFSSALSDLDRAWKEIQSALPYAVCPTCQGKVRESCRLCGGRGFISKFRWDTVVPRETKELRFKVKK